MIERQSIKGKDVWLKVDPYHVHRERPDTIPTEYFTASFYLKEPDADTNGEVLRNEDGEPKMFESPVAALSYARKSLEHMM